MNEMCALVVDDDRPIRALLAATFRRHGIISDEAEDGAVAIERLQTKAYGVVLLDLMMPKVSGQEVLAFMRDHDLTTPVIILSAASQRFLDTIDGPLVRDTIRKPFDLNDVVSRVLALCSEAKATIDDDSA